MVNLTLCEFHLFFFFFKHSESALEVLHMRGACLAQWVELTALDLRVMSLSPHFGCGDYLKIKTFKKKVLHMR